MNKAITLLLLIMVLTGCAVPVYGPDELNSEFTVESVSAGYNLNSTVKVRMDYLLPSAKYADGDYFSPVDIAEVRNDVLRAYAYSSYSKGPKDVAKVGRCMDDFVMVIVPDERYMEFAPVDGGAYYASASMWKFIDGKDADFAFVMKNSVFKTNPGYLVAHEFIHRLGSCAFANADGNHDDQRLYSKSWTSDTDGELSIYEVAINMN